MRDLAHDYLCPEVTTFWRWLEAGEVIAWRDGATITFRTELLEVLRRLAPQGLPPLGAVLLLLAATRDRWQLASAERLLLSPWGSSTDELELTQEVLLGLELVNRLEPELRTSAEARATIADMVFERSRPQLTPQDSASVLRLLEAGLTDVLLEPYTFSTEVEDEDATLAMNSTPANNNFSTRERFRELRALRRGLGGIDPATLKLRLATGLDALPAAAPLDLPAADQIRALLKSLDDDREFHGLARLARDLTAAVTLPRAIADTEEMPLGGVSDISNRGPLDRLLLSELAHDDLVLAVRVAVNEAMYLRRETPPHAPVPGRAVLLDAGIRSWGVPRLFATSVALALAATSDRRAPCAVYRAQGSTAASVDLTRREGLVEHLAALEPDLHPGAALPAFHQALTAAGVVEKVLITTDDVLDDGEFQATLAASELRPQYLISLCRSGRMRLLQCNRHGTKLIREAHLNLAVLLEERSPGMLPLIDKHAARDLPMIFLVAPFPLLLSHAIDDRMPIWLLDDQRVLAITSDRRLMLWVDRRHGAQQISTSMPVGSLQCCSYDQENRIAHAAIGPRGGGGFHLLRIDLEQLQCESQRVNLPPNAAIFSGHQGAIFACSSKLTAPSRQLIVLSEVTGEVICELALPTGATWRGERFFSSHAPLQHFALSFDGQTAHLQTVFSQEQRRRLPQSLSEKGSDPLRRGKKRNENDAPPKGQTPFRIGSQLILMTEHPEVEGPIGITPDSRIVYTATGEVRNIPQMAPAPHLPPVPLRAETLASAPGWVMLSRGSEHCAVELKTLQCQRVSHPRKFPRIFAHEVIRIVNLRYRFTRVYVGAGGALTLISPKGKHFEIALTTPQKICLRLQTAPAPDVSQVQEFQPYSLPVGTAPDFGFSLFEARWPEGSRLFLDGRGLLHLKSSDTAIPEATLVLGDGALSGWCSDGRLWGKAYFIGDHPATADPEIFESVIRPFVERLR